MSFPRYPAYKPSGVKWLGEVPEHWDLSKLGFEAWVRARLGWKGLKAEEYVDSGIAFLSTPNIKGQLIDFSDVSYITPARYDESPEIKLSAGDVLLAKDGSTLGISNVVRTLPGPATVNSSIAVITPSNRLNSIYLYHLLSGTGVQQLIQQKKGGMGVPHLFQSDLVKFAVPVPPSGEQRAIATFLDHETAKIDALISEQQRLIELLQEKRQAVISHAVTKGLNPDAPMKDSGVEWLGEVPEHWEVRKVSHLVDGIGSGTTPRSDTVEYYEDGCIPWVVTGDLNDSYLEACQNQITDKAMAEHTSLRLYPAGSVAVAMYGATIGKASILDFEATVNQACCVLPSSSIVLSGYLLGFILAARTHLLSLATGGGQPNINQEVIRSLRIPLPSLDEQAKITNYVEIATAELESLLDLSAHQVLLLQERRSALISAAVTGQIDVRGLVSEADAA